MKIDKEEVGHIGFLSGLNKAMEQKGLKNKVLTCR